VTLPGLTRTQTYTYDGVNRLKTMLETSGPAESYGYDTYGNRWLASRSGLTYPDPTGTISDYSASTNQLVGKTYDGRGNLQQYDPFTLNYDAENRLVATTSASNGSLTYSYDGEGRRLTKT
jgi:YD repeat-containing protein